MSDLMLTIVTPTYNRAETLPRLYASLVAQSGCRLRWVIVDDGSEDETKEVVADIRAAAPFEVHFVTKPNGGKHTALNVAFQSLHEGLAMIVDSDDMLTPRATEIIAEVCSKYPVGDGVGAYWFLMDDGDGRIIGDQFRKDEYVSDYLSVFFREGVRGDKSVVYPAERLNAILLPVFENEKFFGEGYMHLALGENVDAVFSNHAVYRAEYRNDGLTASGRRLRASSPRGMAALSERFLRAKLPFLARLRMVIRYQVYARIAGSTLYDLLGIQGFRLSAAVLLPVSLLIANSMRRDGQSNGRGSVKGRMDAQ